jgi:hypothetical protein
MRIGLMFLAMVLALAIQPASAATPVGGLQHLLDNAGYNVGGETGKWNDGTAKALRAFAGQYGIEAAPATAPDDTAVTAITAAAKAKLDAAYAAYPTNKLPADYFVGIGSQWYFNIHNWATGVGALVNRDGKRVALPIKRFFEPVDDDIAKFKAAGVNVIRMHLGMEGALFFKECEYQSDRDSAQLDPCYVGAYANAKAEKWVSQSELLGHFSDNPVVKLYVDAVEYWNKNGFHVMFVPNDFFTGTGSHFNGTDAAGGDPLFHRALVSDTGFQKFYPQFVAAVLGEIKKRGLTNVSVQTANEPRFCTEGKPISGGLEKWQGLERAVFDAVRKIAPRISLVSAAICSSGDQFFSQGRPYSNLGQVMPIHADLDDVTYSIHVYSPRALMLAAAQNAVYKPGTLFHYPYQPIPTSAGRNKEAQNGIAVYDRVKPGPQYFEKVFADIEAFAKSKAIRVMITELNAPKPKYGLPREDRVALIRDIVASSKLHNVPLIHFDTVGQWGLSSCPHSQDNPDHRFDPALLNEIAFGNGVAGADPAAPIEPIEVQCGHPVAIEVSEKIAHQGDVSTTINSLFRASINGAPLGEDELFFNIQGTYAEPMKNISSLRFIINAPDLGATAPAGLSRCNAPQSTDVWDNVQHLIIVFRLANGVQVAQNPDCLMKAVPPRVAFQVKFLTTHFRDVAADMVASGNADSIKNDALKTWIQDVAAGRITFASFNGAAPAVAIRTYEDENKTASTSTMVDSVFVTTVKGAKAGEGKIKYAVSGNYSPTTHGFYDLRFTIIDPNFGLNAPAGLRGCRGVSIENFNGEYHLQLRLLLVKNTVQAQGIDCIVKSVSPAMAALVRLLGERYKDLADDMVTAGDADGIGNEYLKAWINDVASGTIEILPPLN